MSKSEEFKRFTDGLQKVLKADPKNLLNFC